MNYFNAVNGAITTRNSALLTSCFTIYPESHYGGELVIQQLVQIPDENAVVFQIAHNEFKELTKLHIRVLKALQMQSFESVSRQLEFFERVKGSDSLLTDPFLYPLIIQTCKQTYQLIKRSLHIHLFFENEVSTKYPQYMRVLIDSVMSKVNLPESNGAIFIPLINCCVKFVFSQLNYTFFYHLLGSYGEDIKRELERCSKSEASTYYYYHGRFSLYSDRYNNAIDDFEKALSLCDPSHTRNVSRILFYLIPLKLVEQKIPSADILNTYQFPIYGQITECVKTGDLRRFDAILNDHLDLFCKRGVYTILSKLRTLVFSHLVIRIAKGTNNLHVEYDMIRQGIHSDNAISDEDINCLINASRQNDYLRGYGSFEHKTAVLSKTYLNS